ncbi:hypothetical protein J6590_032620 [Homalodisca vitripennis]|nr:hypothetical protein J6590_032620 [Homalodisca vitripennis]
MIRRTRKANEGNKAIIQDRKGEEERNELRLMRERSAICQGRLTKRAEITSLQVSCQLDS